jgi:hypothetical protein
MLQAPPPLFQSLLLPYLSPHPFQKTSKMKNDQIVLVVQIDIELCLDKYESIYHRSSFSNFDPFSALRSVIYFFQQKWPPSFSIRSRHKTNGLPFSLGPPNDMSKFEQLRIENNATSTKYSRFNDKAYVARFVLVSFFAFVCCLISLMFFQITICFLPCFPHLSAKFMWVICHLNYQRVCL